MRFQHKDSLMPLSANNLKAPKIYGFDIETANKNRDFLCASIVGADFERQYHTREGVIDEIRTNRIFRNALICATNLMFDFFGLYSGKKAMTEAFKGYSILERQGMLVMAKGYVPYDQSKKMMSKEMIRLKDLDIKDYYPVTFIDSLSHLKSSVEGMGKIIGAYKSDKPTFLGEAPQNDEEWKELEAYNRQDAYVTYRFMEWLANMYKELGCNMKMTVSSTALDLFRRKYLPMPWKCPDRRQVNAAYKAYYGGRTEAFQRGIFNERIKCYDVNSLYPYCMSKFRYPITEDAYHMDRPDHGVIDSFYGHGHAELKAPDIEIPLLPVRSEKLIFPTGRIKGYYDFASLKKACDEGYELLSLKDCWIYEHDHRPFRDYVTDIYKKRIELKGDNNPAELVAKILLNSLYGKFGFQYKNKEMITTNELADDWPCDVSIYPIGNSGFSRVATTENARIPKYVFPVLPQYVTSYARIHMFDKMKSIGFSRVLYTDTDSIFTRRQISTSNELGDVKLEKEFEQLYIIKPKMYGGLMRDGQLMTRIKGLHRYNYSIEQAREMIIEQKLKADMVSFRRLRGSFAHECVVNETYGIHKELSLNDDKRIWERPVITVEPQTSIPLVY